MCVLPSKDTIDPDLKLVATETDMDLLLIEEIVKLVLDSKEIGLSIKEIRV